MNSLLVDARYREAFHQQGWNNWSVVFQNFLPDYVRRQKMRIERVSIPTSRGKVSAFFKLYHHARSGWSFWLRRSKARCEYDNYRTLEQLGVPVAERIACGEERKAGLLQRAFIITREVPDAQELDAYFRTAPTSRLRRQLLTELAEIVRRIHGAGFYHHDLAWRNILVSTVRPGNPKLYLIDCPRGRFVRFSQWRKRLRDLASLDRSASILCSRTERLRFLLHYLGQRRLDDNARRLATACLNYRRTRWPADWNGK
jgi:tRNA A-37 threonylcarbamoyl transferase component Bud32